MNRALLTVLLLLSWTFPFAYPVDSTPAPLGKLVDVGGYRVHLYCTGKGSPAVVIAGAGYSFDWGLVQPGVSEFTEICTYDHSGIAWSDPGPRDSCPLRVKELHGALHTAGIAPPYVMVGHSLGALVARYYQREFSEEVKGMVFVDHAWGFRPVLQQLPLRPGPLFGAGQASTTEDAPVVPKVSQLDDSDTFRKLPPADYQLHQWANSLPGHKAVMSRNSDLVNECSTSLEHKNPPIHSLGNLPLIVLGTQAVPEDLGQISTDERTEIVANSSHFIMIDQPETVITAIREMVEAVRANRPISIH
jgi:pimeloyl-ACP methyl ester carboxylesterase